MYQMMVFGRWTKPLGGISFDAFWTSPTSNPIANFWKGLKGHLQIVGLKGDILELFPTKNLLIMGPLFPYYSHMMPISFLRDFLWEDPCLGDLKGSHIPGSISPAMDLKAIQRQASPWSLRCPGDRDVTSGLDPFFSRWVDRLVGWFLLNHVFAGFLLSVTWVGSSR